MRLLGGGFLLGAGILTILGTTFWRAALTGPLFALYWSWCFLGVVLAMAAAGLDFALLRRAARLQRRQLITDQLSRGRKQP